MKGQTFITTVLVALRSAEAMDWGKMDQYKGKLETPPQLAGNTIWLSGKEGEGFDIVLSKDAQAKVEGILEGCGTADNRCYQDVLDTLQSADLELDNKLERRGLGRMMSKTIKGAWDIFADIATMLTLNWELKSDKMDNSAFYLPQTKAEEAANSAAPAVTTATVDQDGHKKGDLLATLDENLARRIDEVVHRMTDCEDGRKFDIAHGLRKRGGTATYGQALCAAEGVVGMSGKGGSFADLTMLSHDKVGIEFAANAAKAKDALLVLKDFIIAYGPVLAIPEELAAQLGTYILAIIIDALVIENIPIGPMNFIAPDLAVTYGAMSPKPTPTSASATSSSSSGCPDPTKTPLMCGREGDDCDVQLPDPKSTGKREPVCATSKWKGCKCNAPTISFENIIGIEEYEGMQLALKLFKEFKDRPPVRKAKIACRNHLLSAPRSDKDASGGTSVEQAVDTWCRDNDGKDVGPDGLYWRWGVSQLSVPNRSSFWLRAAKTCDKPEKFNRQECQKALMDGMKECDKGPETHGLAASISCIDYSIDLSGITDGGMPPWAEKEEDRKFPPPEFAERKGGDGQGYAPVCDKGDQRLWEVVGKHVRLSATEGAQFYAHEGSNKMHLTFGAETINNGGTEPYQDMRWCKDYDWKLGKDDCTYALRKLYKTCTKDRAKFRNGGEYTYRCVKYKSWAVDTRDN